MKYIIGVLLIFLASQSPAWSAYYFVDAINGNDNNSGRNQNTAWKTIDKVNGFDFDPGDTIQFKRGQVFNGKLAPDASSEGTPGNPIVYRSYGSGPLPIITEKKTLAGFTHEGNNRWSVQLAGDTPRSFVKIARRKSTGFLFRNRKDSASQITGDGDFWHNNASTSPSSHRLWLYATSNPSGDIEVPTDAKVLSIKQDWMEVRALRFDFANTDAVIFYSPVSHILFNSVEITNAGEAGISTSGTNISSIKFLNMKIHHNQGHGLQINGRNKIRDHWSIKYSRVYKNCLDTHDALSGPNAYCAGIKGLTQNGSGENLLIERNHVYENGNVALQNRRIQKGAGIWIDTWEQGTATVQFNRVRRNQLAGILLELTRGQTVQGNVVYENGRGAPYIDFLNGECGISLNRGSQENSVYFNTVYNNRGYQMCIVGPKNSGHFSNHNIVKNNLFIPKNINQGSLLVHGEILAHFNDNDIEYNGFGEAQPNFIRWGTNAGPDNDPQNIQGFSTYSAWQTHYQATTTFRADHLMEFNPQFTYPPGNILTIPASSPAKNQGVSISGIPTDYARTTRTSPPSLGAYE